MEPVLCYIKESYFRERMYYSKMLDTGNTSKQSHRTHLCLKIELDGNKYYIPLRNNLGAEVRKYGRIGHAVPSASRMNAGLDYRYTLVINDDSYIEVQTQCKIPKSQYRRIKNDLERIKKEFQVYLKGYVKSAKKKRNQKEPLYKESSLINYLSDIGVCQIHK